MWGSRGLAPACCLPLHGREVRPRNSTECVGEMDFSRAEIRNHATVLTGGLSGSRQILRPARASLPWYRRGVRCTCGRRRQAATDPSPAQNRPSARGLAFRFSLPGSVRPGIPSGHRPAARAETAGAAGARVQAVTNGVFWLFCRIRRREIVPSVTSPGMPVSAHRDRVSPSGAWLPSPSRPSPGPGRRACGRGRQARSARKRRTGP